MTNDPLTYSDGAEQAPPKDVTPSYMDGQVDYTLIPEDSYFTNYDRPKSDINEKMPEHRYSKLKITADHQQPPPDQFPEVTPVQEDSGKSKQNRYWPDAQYFSDRGSTRPELFGIETETTVAGTNKLQMTRKSDLYRNLLFLPISSPSVNQPITNAVLWDSLTRAHHINTPYVAHVTIPDHKKFGMNTVGGLGAYHFSSIPPQWITLISPNPSYSNFQLEPFPVKWPAAHSASLHDSSSEDPQETPENQYTDMQRRNTDRPSERSTNEAIIRDPFVRKEGIWRVPLVPDDVNQPLLREGDKVIHIPSGRPGEVESVAYDSGNVYTVTVRTPDNQSIRGSEDLFMKTGSFHKKAQQLNINSVSHRVVELLYNAGYMRSANMLALDMGMDVQATTEILQQLQQLGYTYQPYNGVWDLTDAGERLGEEIPKHGLGDERPWNPSKQVSTVLLQDPSVLTKENFKTVLERFLQLHPAYSKVMDKVRWSSANDPTNLLWEFVSALTKGEYSNALQQTPIDVKSPEHKILDFMFAEGVPVDEATIITQTKVAKSKVSVAISSMAAKNLIQQSSGKWTPTDAAAKVIEALDLVSKGFTTDPPRTVEAAIAEGLRMVSQWHNMKIEPPGDMPTTPDTTTLNVMLNKHLATTFIQLTNDPKEADKLKNFGSMLGVILSQSPSQNRHIDGLIEKLAANGFLTVSDLTTLMQKTNSYSPQVESLLTTYGGDGKLVQPELISIYHALQQGDSTFRYFAGKDFKPFGFYTEYYPGSKVISGVQNQFTLSLMLPKYIPPAILNHPTEGPKFIRDLVYSNNHIPGAIAWVRVSPVIAGSRRNRVWIIEEMQSDPYKAIGNSLEASEKKRREGAGQKDVNTYLEKVSRYYQDWPKLLLALLIRQAKMMGISQIWMTTAADQIRKWPSDAKDKAVVWPHYYDRPAQWAGGTLQDKPAWKLDASGGASGVVAGEFYVIDVNSVPMQKMALMKVSQWNTSWKAHVRTFINTFVDTQMRMTPDLGSKEQLANDAFRFWIEQLPPNLKDDQEFINKAVQSVREDLGYNIDLSNTMGTFTNPDDEGDIPVGAEGDIINQPEDPSRRGPTNGPNASNPNLWSGTDYLENMSNDSPGYRKSVRDAIDRITDKYLDGLIPKEEYERRMKELASARRRMVKM